jgi:hypothetical protein
MATRARLATVTCAVMLGACQPLDSVAEAPPPPVDNEVLAFAQAACGGCHAVEQDMLSPNPLAPEWPRIVNTPGLTSASLERWLVDAHNYPEEMDFDLDAPQVEDLVAYMLGLRREGYEPPSL